MRSSILLPVALAPLTSAMAPLPADDGGTSQDEAVITELGTLPELPLLFDEPGDGALWVHGRTWKGSFAPDGVTYVPFFGSRAETTYPLTFGAATAALGGDELAVSVPRGHGLDGRSVTLDRGAFREVYHADLERLEQTFVFDELPSRDELVVRFEVTSTLAAEPHDGGFRFSGPDGAVTYGRATAVDAGGRTAALEQRLVDGRIEITVPADFVAAAELPLTIDPIVVTRPVTNDPRLQVHVDIAYDAANGQYFVVYVNEFAGTDHDVFGAFVDATSLVVGGPAVIDTTMENWRAARVASCFFQEDFLCVAAVGAPGSDRDVWGRIRSASSGTVGPKFQISTAVGDHHSPDVGGFGNDSNTSFSFAVVWQRDTPAGGDGDILVRGVTSFGTLVGNQTAVAFGQATDQQRPTISIRTGPQSLVASDHRYLIAWERIVGPSDSDLWGRVMDFDIDFTGHAPFPIYTFSNSTSPAVSSMGTSVLTGAPVWMVVFSRLVGSDRQIFAVMTEEGDADNARSIPVMQNLQLTQNQLYSSIAFDGEDYMVTYRGSAGLGATGYFTALNATPDTGELRSGLAERRSVVGPNDNGNRRIVIASQYEGGGPPGDRAMAATIHADTMTGETDVAIAVALEATTAVRGAQYCTATPNSTGISAWIRASSMGYTNAAPIELTCTDLPPNASAYFLVAPASGFVANPAGSAGHLCLSGPIGRYSNFVANAGAQGRIDLTVDPMNLSAPMGTVTAVAGDAWYFQCWNRDSAGGMATSNFSNAVEVYFL